MKLSALEPYLDLMISNEDVSKGKPDPEMYLQAMSTFDLKLKNVLSSKITITVLRRQSRAVKPS